MRNALGTLTHQKEKKKKKKLNIQDLSWFGEDENITIKIWEYVMTDVRGRAKLAMVSKSMNVFWRLGYGKCVITSAEDLVVKYYNMDPKTIVSRQNVEAPGHIDTPPTKFSYKMIWPQATLYNAVPQWRLNGFENTTFTLSLADFFSGVIKQSEHERESGWNENLFRTAQLVALTRRKKAADRLLASINKEQQLKKRDRDASIRLEKTLVPKMRTLVKEHMKKVVTTKGGVVNVCKRLRKEVTVWEREFYDLGKLHSLPVNNSNLEDESGDDSLDGSESNGSSEEDDDDDDDESN